MIEPIAMFPVYITKQLSMQKQFYEQHLGFSTEFYDSDFYVHLLHPTTGAQIGFMVPDHPSQPDFLQQQTNVENMVISFEVKNAKEAYTAAKHSNLPIVFELKKEEFGLSHFMVKDPAGFIIDVVEHHEPE